MIESIKSPRSTDVEPHRSYLSVKYGLSVHKLYRMFGAEPLYISDIDGMFIMRDTGDQCMGTWIGKYCLNQDQSLILEPPLSFHSVRT